MRARVLIRLLAIIISLQPAGARAQAPVAHTDSITLLAAPHALSSAQRRPTADYMLSAWIGLSTVSTTWAPLGAVPDTKLGVLALRLSRRLGAQEGDDRASRSLWYTLDVIPVAIISPAYVSAPGGPGCQRRQACAFPRSDSSSALFPPGSVVGAGIAPLGVTALFRAPHALQFTLGATGGAMWFTEPVPTTRASHGNFTASVESGMRYATRCGLAWTFTYRFHHISNAWLGEENPAVGSHLFSIGIDRGQARRSVNSSAC